jgi:DNA helicase II / ATP-dependent DNA helicase PcrA
VSFPGPPEFGRGVVVAPGKPPPVGLPGDAERILIDHAAVENPKPAAERLHRLWAGRRPHVIELAVPNHELRTEETTSDAPYELGGEFLFDRERLFFLCWANTYDARDGDPIWWWGQKLEPLGVRPGGDKDVVLSDGTPAWVDGGPRRPWSSRLGPVIHREALDAGRLVVDIAEGVYSPDGLAEDQLRAVLHPSGPARIIAPAGSGKTRTMAARLVHLLDDRGWQRELLTGLAYNKRAALELSDRLERPELTVRTIHSLGWEILRQARPSLRLVNEPEVRRLLERIAPVSRRVDTDAIGPYIEALSEIRIGLRPPEEVEAQQADVPDLPRVFGEFRRRLRAGDLADYDEQIYGAIEALLTDPTLRRRWQRSLRHLLVDEFQDLTPAYLLLIRLVASPTLEVFGVGDDDQTIYGYAGATPDYLIRYSELFPGAGEHALEVNYRCPTRVVAAASTLLTHNRRRVDKVIRHGPEAAGDDDGLSVLRLDDEQMAETVTSTVAGWIADGTPPASIAVLARVNSALLPVQVALVEGGIAVDSSLTSQTLARTVLRDALAWVRIGLRTEPLPHADLAAVVRRPQRGLNRAFDQVVPRRALTVEELDDLADRLPEKQQRKWRTFVGDIRMIRRLATSHDSVALLEAVVEDVGLSSSASALDRGRSPADRSTHTDDIKALLRTAFVIRDARQFEKRLSLALAVQNEPDGVRLTSIHRVKGMEWDRVIVIGADDGVMPHRLADDLEEERRVFHVAITRGRRQVMIVTDQTNPSPFLDQLSRKAEPARTAPTQEGRSRSRRMTSAPRTADGITPKVDDHIRLVDGGFSGRVESIDEDGVLVRVDGGSAVLTARWGDRVGIGTRRGTLQPAAAEPDHVDAALFDRLKEWRRIRAADDGVPAFVVFHDTTLQSIARTRPQNLAELSRVQGIGPVKLELYGDDILEICGE